jgi:hypothetical protein
MVSGCKLIENLGCNQETMELCSLHLGPHFQESSPGFVVTLLISFLGNFMEHFLTPNMEAEPLHRQDPCLF